MSNTFMNLFEEVVIQTRSNFIKQRMSRKLTLKLQSSLQ